jgi:hypothetical protein
MRSRLQPHPPTGASDMQPSTLLAAVAPTASKHSAPHLLAVDLLAVDLLAVVDEMGGGRVDVRGGRL